MLVTPSATAMFIAEAGMVAWTDKVVPKVPGAVMLGAGDGDSDNRMGKVVLLNPAPLQV
jgi:hypothetical protein